MKKKLIKTMLLTIRCRAVRVCIVIFSLMIYFGTSCHMYLLLVNNLIWHYQAKQYYHAIISMNLWQNLPCLEQNSLNISVIF